MGHGFNREGTPNIFRTILFIIVATDYFTKWVEAVPSRTVTQSTIINFIDQYIVHRFGPPETITADQWTVFIGTETFAFAKKRGMTILNSTPYYAQANG